MTRFSIDLKNSTIFVSKILKKMQGGEIFVPKLKSYKLIDLTKAINKNAKIKYIGFRPGEKLHEEMISETESKNTVEYEDSFVIYPHLIKRKINKKIVNGYRSDVNEFLKISEIEEIIKKEKKIEDG
jgi:UDP-N-acetylglucosamine 4,6-dehydratase